MGGRRHSRGPSSPPPPPPLGVGAGADAAAAAAAAIAAQPPQIIECLTCERRFCRCCNLESLDGRCPRQEGKNEDALHALIAAEGMKRCPQPGCGIPTAKESGCNRVYCRACKKNWCWLCGELTGGEGLPQNTARTPRKKGGSAVSGRQRKRSNPLVWVGIPKLFENDVVGKALAVVCDGGCRDRGVTNKARKILVAHRRDGAFLFLLCYVVNKRNELCRHQVCLGFLLRV